MNWSIRLTKSKVSQVYLGEKLKNNSELSKGRNPQHEMYIPFGTSDLFESAIRTTHNDGNPSIDGIDNNNSLRVISGINPYASEYRLIPGKTFTTPSFVFTYSKAGKELTSQNLQRWSRKYSLLDGDQPRMTLLNNWETTFFDFNEIN